MMLKKKLFRTIWAKKAQFFAAWLLIVISSMVYYAFTTAGINLIENLDYFFQENKVEDAHFMVEKPITDVEQLEKKYHIELEKRSSLDVSFSKDSTLRILNETEKLNRYSVVKGKPLRTDSDLLIDQGYANAHKLKIGQQLQLNGRTFQVTGMMAIPDYIYPLKAEGEFLKNPETFGIAVVKQNVFSQWNHSQNFYSVRFLENNHEDVKRYLNQEFHLSTWVDKKENNRISFVKGDIAGVKAMGEWMPVGMLFISMVMILIILWRMMKVEYVQIGTFYALGLTKGEIIRHYLSYAGLLGISGGVIGTLLGWMLLRPLLSAFAAFYNLPVLTVGWNSESFLISLFLPLVFVLPLTYFLIHRVLRIPPVLLMKGGEVKIKVNKLEKMLKLRSLPFKRKFVVREIFRNLPRILFLVIGVIFATVLLLFGFVTKKSMDYLVTENYQKVYHYQYNYLLNGLQTSPPPSGQIGSSAPYTIELDNKKQQAVIYGLKEDNTAIRLNDSNGKSLKFDSVMINQSLADKMGLEVGDRIKATNRLTNQSFELTIDHIALSYLGDMIYMPLKEYNEANGYMEDSYTEIFSDEKIVIPKENLAATIQSSDTIEGFKQLLKPLNYGIAFLAFIAGMIAVIIMYLLISLLIEESSYKISLMKVVGYKNKVIKQIMIHYHIWFVLLGFLIGIPVTLTSISAFLNSITAEMNVTFPVRIDGVSIAISFVILILAYYLSIWLNHKKLRNVKLTEAIKRSAE